MSCNQTLTVGDIAQVFDGPHATPKKIEAGPYFLSISSLENGKLDLSKSAHVSDEDFKKWTRRVTPEEGDILFSYETRLGEVAMMPAGVTACLGRRMGLLRPDRTKILPEYLLYAYQSPAFQETIRSKTIHGATVDRIALKELPSFPIQVPPILEQEKIVNVLKGYDRKLILNAETNKTLEQMAQAIFKSWFVDFDPVKAKMNGEQPEGMDAATASLFPEKLVESELGLIPDGWEVKPFSEWVKITKGKNITKKTIVDGDVPVVAGGLKPAYFHNVHNVDGPAITISASGANAGYVNLYFENIWASDCSYISQSTTPLFFLQYVALRYNQKKIFDMQTGAAQPHIYPRDFERLMIVVPNEELCRKLEEVFASFFRTVANNKQQNIDLAALRDTLLPKLLSGEIELDVAEVNTNE